MSSSNEQTDAPADEAHASQAEGDHQPNENADISVTYGTPENPFKAEGQLSQKADYIISHSTITRSNLRISDPDLQTSAAETPVVVEVVKSSYGQPVQAKPKKVYLTDDDDEEEKCCRCCECCCGCCSCCRCCIKCCNKCCMM